LTRSGHLFFPSAGGFGQIGSKSLGGKYDKSHFLGDQKILKWCGERNFSCVTPVELNELLQKNLSFDG